MGCLENHFKTNNTAGNTHLSSFQAPDITRVPYFSGWAGGSKGVANRRGPCDHVPSQNCIDLKLSLWAIQPCSAMKSRKVWKDTLHHFYKTVSLQ